MRNRDRARLPRRSAASSRGRIAGGNQHHGEAIAEPQCRHHLRSLGIRQRARVAAAPRARPSTPEGAARAGPPKRTCRRRLTAGPAVREPAARGLASGARSGKRIRASTHSIATEISMIARSRRVSRDTDGRLGCIPLLQRSLTSSLSADATDAAEGVDMPAAPPTGRRSLPDS